MAYEEKDFVEIVGENGEALEGFEQPVPKKWIGTPLVPSGAKAKSAARASRAAKQDDPPKDPPKAPEKPSGDSGDKKDDPPAS